MKPEQRLVTHLPITTLWDKSGPLAAFKLGILDRSSIADSLSHEDVIFVVANIGHPLEWILEEKKYELWKAVREQVISPETTYQSDGKLRFRVSAWQDPSRGKIFVLKPPINF